MAPALSDHGVSRIALIGMEGRFPGANSLDALWSLLREGRHGIRQQNRWDPSLFDPMQERPGTVVSDQLGQIDGIDHFDHEFFGLPAAEARTIDPQQRLLLEVAWRAFEHAGFRPSQLSSRRVGVWIAAGGSDYASLAIGSEEAESIWFAFGADASLLANGLSRRLDLAGPSVVVNAGCASVVVALESASRALAEGTVDFALVGGVSLVLDSRASCILSNGLMLSANGQCRPFDADADGYVRGEGVACVVLRRCEEAERDGDPILAVLRGAAVHHGGRNKGQLVSSQAIVACLQQSLAAAGVRADEIDYMEAHALGAPAGDEAELRALLDVFPTLRIGSSKANLGHLEWAAGMASLAKLVLMFRHREVPPQLHFDQPIEAFDTSRFTVDKAPGVFDGSLVMFNALSIGGACGSVVLEAPPARAQRTPEIEPHLIALSSPDASRLAELAASWARSGSSTTDAAFTLATRRETLAVRGAVVVEDLGRLEAPLILPAATGVVWAFTGQGSQRPGMGLQLAEHCPEFAAALDRVGAALRPTLGMSIRDLLVHPQLSDTRFSQPAIFALEVALAETWSAWGARPDAVIGHSIGEIAACVVAGIMDLEDAAAFVVERGRLMSELPAGGGMLVAFATADEVRPFLTPGLAIAAINGPELTVVSGALAALDVLAEQLDEAFLTTVKLDVSHAFHSSLMDPILAPLDAAARRLTLREGRIPLYSTLLGETVRSVDSSYWMRHAREAVLFGPTVEKLPPGTLVLEIGPAATLTRMGVRLREDCAFVPSLTPDGEWRGLLEAAGKVWCAGIDLMLDEIEGRRGGRAIHGPGLTFAKHAHWFGQESSAPAQDFAAMAAEVLGRAVDRDRGLMDQGFDSLRMVVLAERLGLPVVDVFGAGTVAALEAQCGSAKKRSPVVATASVSNEPIAVVGMACRLPGAPDITSFWQLLREGKDATGPIPDSRRDTLGPADLRGGFLPDVAGFDAEFWGMSGREAALLDPQHRLVLEVGWEALEDAGLTREQLAGSATGVYLGLIGQDFSHMHARSTGVQDAYEMLGSLPSAAAGRLSHLLDLRSPALVVDTACSSSLLTLHLATQALRAGECDRAIAGGVNVILDPGPTSNLRHAGALDAKGQCRTFDASAAGYARAEGCGMVVLRRLSDARRDGDRILAIVRATGANHDGHASGLTAPSGVAQRTLLERTLAISGVEARQIGYVETHGTGTPLGDPIEVAALRGALAVDQREMPLRLGSVKTNIGHTEGAAGAASLIKICLVLAHGEIPPHLHFDTPNPLIDLRGLEIPVKLTPLVGDFAALSSFGMSGTNVHAILERAPADPRNGSGPKALVLSARTSDGVRTLARSWRLWCDGEGDLSSALATAGRRTRHAITIALPAADRAELRSALDRFLVTGEAAHEVPTPERWSGARTTIPPYPWQRSRHWPEKPAEIVPAARPDPDGMRLEIGWEVSTAPLEPRGSTLDAREGNPIELLTELADRVRAGETSLVVVTRGAFPATADRPRGAALWGAARVLQSERPDLDIRVVDSLEWQLPERVPRTPEAAWRDGHWHVPVLRRQPVLDATLEGTRRVLELPRPGFLGEAQWRWSPALEARRGQVEVAVSAAGISGADIDDLLFRSEGQNDGPVGLGREFAGVVVSVGTGVARVGVGDRVMGLAPYGIGTRVTVDEHLVVRAPSAGSLSEIAGMPLSFAVAWRALVELAAVSTGEVVLLHTATGGVGQLALQIARSRGAIVVATAGSDARRDWLRRQGIAVVVDSRSPDFVMTIREALDGRGVDVALCDLERDGLRLTAELLAPGGRLIDIGRRPHAAASLPAGAACFRLDIIEEARRNPARLSPVLDRLSAMLSEGILAPATTRTFPAGELHSALRWPVRAMHLGKIVIETPSEHSLSASPGRILALGPGPVLVTGGLGALGMSVAERLAERGCRHLVLVGRRASREALRSNRILERLTRGGVRVELRAVDVSDRKQVRGLVESLPELEGIVHCAGVLDDGAMTDLTSKRFETVWASKAAAAWHLHEAAPKDLRFFVLFSSVASWIGTAGQANYAAANAELDALAAWRRQLGLRAISIGWGPWAGGGMASGLERLSANAGIRFLDPQVALDAMEALIVENRDAAVLDLAPGGLQGASRALTVRAPSLVASGGGRPQLDTLRVELAAILRMPVERIHGSLRDLGLDSIMANELRARVAGLPSTQLLTSGVSVEALAGEPAELPEPMIGRHVVPARRVVDRLSPIESPKGRLICFPFAGVGSSFFRDWHLGDGIEIASVQYRGRGSRVTEAPFHRMEPLVRELADEIAPLMDRPMAFFGHCMGALVAFLCAHELRRRGLAPEHLFLSASPPPDVYKMPWWDPATGRFMNVERVGRSAIHDLPTDAFLDVLRFLDFPPARTLLRETNLLPQVLPMVRADFETCATWRWTHETPLDSPITAFAGAEDPFFDRELDAALVGADIGGWKRQTRGRFQSFTRPGDHYFLVPEREFLLDTIREALSWT